MKYLLAFLCVVSSLISPLAAEEPYAPHVRCIESDTAILVKIGDRNVLRYNKITNESPAGIDPVYRRSGYIHPVFTPDGKQLTGDFPVDHPHQHALFSAWRMVEFEGREISFWDQLAKTGRVSHAKVISTENGTDSCRFMVELLLEDLSAPAGPKPVLFEIWAVTVYNRGEDRFVFDIETVHRCASAEPVTVLKYHYGGMAFRGCDQWYSDKAQAAYVAWEKELKSDSDSPRPPLDVMQHEFLTSEGKHQYDGNHSRPRWVDLSGPIDEQLYGIAILGHPDNFRAPQHVRLHPSKPYLSFSPMVKSAFEITPEKPFRSKYRFVVHKGQPTPGQLDAEWQRFAE